MLSHSPAGKGATIASISAVSDIHGHLEALHAALDIVDLEGNPDASLVLLGTMSIVGGTPAVCSNWFERSPSATPTG